MAEDGKSPILNPVLALRREARRASVTGGGKQAKDIRVDRFGPQQRKLVADLRKIQASPDDIVSFGGMVRLVARMFEDSLATSFTPASFEQVQSGLTNVALEFRMIATAMLRQNS